MFTLKILRKKMEAEIRPLMCLILVVVLLRWQAEIEKKIKVEREHLKEPQVNAKEIQISPLLNQLTTQVDHTAYRNYIDLYLQPGFQNNLATLKKLNLQEYKILIKKMFHFGWNLPKPEQNFEFKRLPDVIILGSKKCSTTAFSYYMGMHPNFKCPKSELRQFDLEGHYKLGFEHYLSRLPVTFGEVEGFVLALEEVM